MISDEEHEQNIISLLNNLKGYSSDDILKEYYLFELGFHEVSQYNNCLEKEIYE